MVNQVDVTDSKVSNIEVLNMIKLKPIAHPGGKFAEGPGVTGSMFVNAADNLLYIHNGTTFTVAHAAS
tara:strand:- start:7058 stop:7261 length:204 start_codon:yes stop_codon:yes gene_type:complete